MAGKSPNKKMVKTELLADLFSLTTRRIQQLAAEQYLTATKVSGEYQFELFTTIKEYIQYVKDHPEGKDDEETQTLLTQKLKAEVDMKKAKAKMAQLELKEFEGNLHRSDDVEQAVTGIVVNLRSLLMALPGQLASPVTEANTAAEAAVIIRKTVDKTLSELAEYRYDPNVYRASVRERKGLRKKDEDETIQ